MRMVDKIKAALESKGWTQSAFEKLALLSENKISKWKDDKGRPTAQEALRMARLLEISVEYLIDDDQEEPPRPAPVLSEREAAILAIVRTRERIEGTDVLSIEEINWRLSGPVARFKEPPTNKIPPPGTD